MLETIGKRLKCCRAATGTTPQEIVNHIHNNGVDISYTTYTRWEAGSSFPSRKIEVMSYISDFFKKNGLNVEANWILSGEGFPPQFAEYSNLDEDTLFILASRTMPNVELIQIGGVYGEPFVKYGEFCIIANNSDIDSNNNKLCYVKTKSQLLIGVVIIINEHEILIKSDNPTNIAKSEAIECRRIRWIQKK